MSELHRTEVDHVTTIWTDAPPPLRAGLLFRTGRIDETLATAGHTHLVEHLALSTLGDTIQPHNGFVGGPATVFFTMGKPEDVTSFLAGVCTALASLPSDRLAGEKQILATENAARPYDFRSNLLIWRYGATGYGQLGMAELGIPRATLEQLQEYAAQRFTKENAVLWLSGPPPTDLCLSLPHGAKQPLPPLSLVQQTFPCWFLDSACRGVAAGATVPRVSASSPFCEIASRRLRKRLRTAQAVSYAPSVFYDHLTSQTAHLVLYADSNEEHREELANLFGEIFAELGEIEESEVEAAKSHIRESWIGALAPPPADRALVEVQRAAMDWILGRDYQSLESVATELLSVTRDDVSAFYSEIGSTAMFALPSGVPLQPCFGERASLSMGPAVNGPVTQSVDAPICQERLVHGPDGVSILFPDGSHCTVRYSELAAAVYYEDGGVCLIGVDAATVTVEPTLWRGGESVCHRIREQVPVHLVVDQRSRPANTIPRPSTTAWQRFRARLTKR
jgi:predicted Zn-dependent peptidase